MTKISVSLPDHLLTYLDSKVDNRSQLIEALLREWQQQQENEALVKACELVDQFNLGGIANGRARQLWIRTYLISIF